MLYHVLINKTDTESNHNVLVMNNVLDKGLEKLNRNLNLSKDELNEIKNLILTNQSIPEKYELEYLTLDDDDICIPCYNPIILTCVNNEPYKWFGNYSNYVMRLWGEDMGAKNPHDVEIISDYSESCPKFIKNIDLDNGSSVNITGICVYEQIFD